MIAIWFGSSQYPIYKLVNHIMCVFTWNIALQNQKERKTSNKNRMHRPDHRKGGGNFWTNCLLDLAAIGRKRRTARIRRRADERWIDEVSNWDGGHCAATPDTTRLSTNTANPMATLRDEPESQRIKEEFVLSAVLEVKTHSPTQPYCGLRPQSADLALCQETHRREMWSKDFLERRSSPPCDTVHRAAHCVTKSLPFDRFATRPRDTERLQCTTIRLLRQRRWSGKLSRIAFGNDLDTNNRLG